MTRMSRRLVVLSSFASLACKGGDATPALGVPAGPAAPARIEDGARTGDSVVVGAAGGAGFAEVGAAFVVENPDSDETTVIYLLSKTTRCVDLSFSRWVDAIESGTTVLELKVFGKVPGTFLVVTTPTPSGRQATAAVSRTSTKGASNEARSTGGWITLESLPNRDSATGSFDLKFTTGHLTGKFNAAFCPNGHEP
jgi:hypothetical protein